MAAAPCHLRPNPWENASLEAARQENARFMNPDHTLVITSRDLNEIVKRIGVNQLMDELLVSLEDALRHLDHAQTQVVPRHGFSYDRPNPGVLEWMPAMVVGRHAVIKVVSYTPSNPDERGIPTIVSTISVYDVSTGRLVALVDGILPTALRTGAASVVASTRLARPDSSVLGLIGCGAQAVTQLHALSRRFDLKQVLVFDIDASAARSFVDRVAFLGLPVRVVPRAVLERESDIICTATSAAPGTGPVVDDRHFKPWIHVNAVGSDLPGKTELPLAFLKRSVVCPDFVEQALVEGEAQQLTRADLGPCLSDLVKSKEDVAAWQERPTVFDSTGFVVEDVVVVELFLRHARALGIGRSLSIQGLSGDPKNPYGAINEPADVERGTDLAWRA